MADDNSDNSQWRESEVSDLINVWGDRSIQAKLEGSYRNRAVFEMIAKEMAGRGYRRSWLQCQRKIKSLRAKYKEAKDSNKRSGRARVTCPFYEELDRILGDKASVEPIELLDSCVTEEEPCPNEKSPGPAASAASPASSSNDETADGTLASLSPASATEGSSSQSEETSVNSSAPSTSTGSISAKNRKRKSKMEATLEVFAEKITSAFKNEDGDLLLKMQAAQHEHDRKMFMMLSQFMERSSHPPQPPHYQAPMQSSQLYNPRHPPSHHSSVFPMASAPSPTQHLSFLQDLSQPLPFNNAHPHQPVTQPFLQTLANTQDQHAFIPPDHPPPFQPQDED